MRPLAALALLLAVAAPAAAIEGRYRVVGTVPGDPRDYRGEAQIKRTGDTYTIVWRVGPVPHLGTGLVSGQTLSVVYLPIGGRPGLAVYSIRDGRVAEGIWAELGGQHIATEQWSPAQQDP